MHQVVRALSRPVGAAAFAAALLAAPPLPASAHQPAVVEGDDVVAVVEPEVSKAYYGELDGNPTSFVIEADSSFDLYVGLSVPDAADAEQDFVVRIADGSGSIWTSETWSGEWTAFHEEFANDDYLQGPEFRLPDAPPGRYDISVGSPDNRGKFVLAVGEKEEFGLEETLYAYSTVPRLKAGFFGKTGWSFALSYLGAPLVALSVLFGAALGLLNRRLMRYLPARKGRPAGHARNIGRADRLLRLAIGLVLLTVGLHFWQPLLFVAAGFTFYEAAAKWCVIHAALGRNTCPIS